MHGGTVVDSSLIAAPKSTKNQSGKHDPKIHQTKKGNEWYFSMKVHAGVDAATSIELGNSSHSCGLSIPDR